MTVRAEVVVVVDEQHAAIPSNLRLAPSRTHDSHGPCGYPLRRIH